MVIRATRERLRRAFPDGSLQARFARGTFWAFLGTAISQALGLAAWVTVARLLGTVGFGELGIIRSTVGMLGVFAGFALGLTVTKHVAELHRSDPSRAGRIIGMSSAVAAICGSAAALVMFLLAPYLAEHTINAPHLVPELRIGCALLLLNSLTGVQTGALAGFEAFRTIARVSLLRGMLNFPFMLAGVYFWGLRGGVCALVAVAAAAWLLNEAALRREADRAGVSVTCRNMRTEFPILLKFSLPAVMSGALIGPAVWAARAVLVNEPNGYAELGLFAAANRFSSVLYMASIPLGGVLLPMLASPEGSASERFNRANILLSWLLGAAPAVVLICFPEVLSLLYGSEYAGPQFTRTVVLVMCFSCVVTYKQGLARVLAARSLMWWAALSNSFWALVLVAAAFGMARWGAVGLAGAFAVAHGLNTLVFIPLYVRKGLVPRKTMVSKEAALIWGTIAVAAALSLTGAPLAARTVMCPAALALLVCAFLSLSQGDRSRGREPVSAAADRQASLTKWC